VKHVAGLQKASKSVASFRDLDSLNCNLLPIVGRSGTIDAQARARGEETSIELMPEGSDNGKISG
jgi:hypothetical protein